MSEELNELLDNAIYKEISAQAFYIAGQDRTDDPGARTLMRELADEEFKHSVWLEGLKEKGLTERTWRKEKVPDLKISEYLVGSDTLDGASLQDTLVFAMKREQRSVEFYTGMMSVMKEKAAKRLCERLVNAELKHKYRLEIFYDDQFF